MLLMIDIGNSNIVLGLFNESRLTKSWRLSSHLNRTEDECWTVVESFFLREKIDPEKIAGVSISSVVPALTLTFSRMVQRYLKSEPLIIGANLDLGMEILYEDKNAVGADRLCNAVAGRAKYGAPLIILDFGTATTFDCVDSEGNYLGGIICPGIESTASALHHKAAKLPKIDLKFPRHLIGRNTEESMQSGIMYGTVELIEGMVAKIKKELGDDAKVIATGGLARTITSHTKSIDYVDENLNLEGILLIYLRQKQEN